MQLAPAGSDSLTDVLPLYERTWQLLNDAQIALYPVDVKGLTTNTPPASIRTPSASNRPGGYYRSASWRQVDTQATLQTFASATGGRAYYNSNDLANSFHDSVAIHRSITCSVTTSIDRTRNQAGGNSR
jgi:hypothetical protein